MGAVCVVDKVIVSLSLKSWPKYVSALYGLLTTSMTDKHFTLEVGYMYNMCVSFEHSLFTSLWKIKYKN